MKYKLITKNKEKWEKLGIIKIDENKIQLIITKDQAKLMLDLINNNTIYCSDFKGTNYYYLKGFEDNYYDKENETDAIKTVVPF